MKQEMQRERVNGFKDFIEDVKNRKFPSEEHVVRAPKNLITNFLLEVEKDPTD